VTGAGKATKERPEECECCGFETKALDAYQVGGMGYREPKRDAWYCLLCASTMTSNAHYHHSNYYGTDTVLILQTICYVGNAIIAALEERGKS